MADQGVDHGVTTVVVGPRVMRALEAYRIAMDAYEITGADVDRRAVERCSVDVAQALADAFEATEALL